MANGGFLGSVGKVTTRGGPVPVQRVHGDTGLGELRKGLSDVAKLSAGLAEKFADEVVKTETTTAVSAATRSWLEKAHGENGFYSLKGRAALPGGVNAEGAVTRGVVIDGLNEYDEITRVTGGDLRGRVRDAFLLARARGRAQEHEGLLNYAETQREVWRAASRQGELLTDMADVAANPNASNVKTHDAIKRAGNRAADSLGLPLPDDPEAAFSSTEEVMERVNAVALAERTALVEARIDSLLLPGIPNGPGTAQALLGTALADGHFDPRKAADVKKRILTVAGDVDSQVLTDRIVDANPNGTNDEWAKAARSQSKGKLRDDTLARLRQRSSSRTISTNQARAARSETVHEDARKYLDTPERTPVLDAAAYDASMSLLKGDEAGRQAFTKWWDLARVGKQPITDFALFETLVNKPPSYWVDKSASQFRSSLGNVEHKQLIAHVKDAKNGVNTEMTTRINNHMNSIGLVTKSNSTASKRKRGIYYGRMLAGLAAKRSEVSRQRLTENEILDVFSVVDRDWSEETAAITGLEGSIQKMTDEDVIETTNDSIVALALDRATEAGKRTATRTEVVAQIQIIAREVETNRREMDPDTFKKWADAVVERGGEARTRLDKFGDGFFTKSAGETQRTVGRTVKVP